MLTMLEPHMVLFVAPTGVGKTHLALDLLKQEYFNHFACHREEQTCFCLLFISVIYITLNNFRILPFILDLIS